MLVDFIAKGSCGGPILVIRAVNTHDGFYLGLLDKQLQEAGVVFRRRIDDERNVVLNVNVISEPKDEEATP